VRPSHLPPDGRTRLTGRPGGCPAHPPGRAC
jgi:hypothetical protein